MSRTTEQGEAANTLKFTPTLVRTLGPGEYRDTVREGLVLRVRDSGYRSFSIRYLKDGKWDRITLGPPSDSFTLADAREKTLVTLHEITGGKNPAEERRQARNRQVLLVAQLVRERLAAAVEAQDLMPSTAKEWLRLAEVEIIPHLGDRPAGELTRREVRVWLEPIRARSGSTANNALKVLRRCYNLGIKFELVETSPCIGVEKPSPEEASERVLATLEVRALWKALEVLGTGQLADAVRLLLLTGVRKGMVLGANRREFEGLDEDDPRWTIPGGFRGRSKSRRPHVVPLSAQALAVVRRRMAATSGEYLFPAVIGSRFTLEDVRRVEAALSEGLSQRAAGRLVGMSQTEVARINRGEGRTSLRQADRREGPMAIGSTWVATLKLATRWALWDLLAGHAEHGPALATMEPWTVHELRHTIATHMTEDLGVHENVVSLILGHKVSGPDVSRIYNRAVRLPERRAALVAWAAWVEKEGPRVKVLPMRSR